MPVGYPIQRLLPFTYVIKATDTSRASTTTMADDPGLIIDVLASTLYVVKVVLLVQGVTGDSIIKVGWSYPVGTTIKWTFDSIYEAASNLTNSVKRTKLEQTSTEIGLCDSSQDAWYEMNGFVTTSTTAGSLAVMWAQNASTANATKVLADSEIQLTQRQASA